MAEQRACKQCKTLFEGSKCPKCGSAEYTTSFKGKINVINPENSEIAKNLKINTKGSYAVRTN